MKTKSQSKRDRAHMLAGFAMLAPCAAFLGAIVWGAFYPHGIIARGLIAILKSSPF
jgi:hypothetical protein